MDKEITKCITNIFDTLNAKSEEETIQMFGQAIKYAQESKVKINNPEYFNTFVNHRLRKGIDLLANTLHEPSINKDKNKPNFIYTNYDFLESHIRNLCKLREGSSCCADKSRYILNMYLKYSITGEIPEFNPDLEEYWIPKFGNNETWIKYCDSLYRLYYGYTEEYFNMYSTLVNCKIRQYKHILHRWFMKFNDGEVIEYGYTWDENNINPLSNFDEKDDCYIIDKKYVENKNFEVYVPKDKELKLLYRDSFVKVPKSEIKEIYKISEERMI